MHPCQFPIELIERCVLAFTNENDCVLDPFGGVGSTMLAALRNNRRAVTVEINEEYSSVARERLAALEDGTLKYRCLGREIARPTGKVARIPEAWKD